MIAPLPAELIAALQELDTCTVANTIDSLRVRLRNEGYTDSSIRCLTPKPAPLVGYAVTVRVRCSDPQTEGREYPDRTDWWSHLLSIPGPRIVVIQDVDKPPGAGAFPGEVHASIWKALGCVGAITNGAVHDLPGIQKMDFYLFAGSLTVSHAYAHVVEFGRPVQIGGLQVQPGDLLHADVHGILSVPGEIASRIPAAARALLDRERRIFDLCRSGGATVEALRDLVKQLP